MYIVAGKKRLAQIRTGELEELRKKAEASPAPRRMLRPTTTWSIMCNRFEKKIHDLELTRVISIQMGPQTRLHPEQRHADDRKRSRPPW